MHDFGILRDPAVVSAAAARELGGQSAAEAGIGSDR